MLPNEVICDILPYLDFNDLINLSQSSQRLRFIVHSAPPTIERHERTMIEIWGLACNVPVLRRSARVQARRSVALGIFAQGPQQLWNLWQLYHTAHALRALSFVDETYTAFSASIADWALIWPCGPDHTWFGVDIQLRFKRPFIGRNDYHLWLWAYEDNKCTFVMCGPIVKGCVITEEEERIPFLRYLKEHMQRRLANFPTYRR